MNDDFRIEFERSGGLGGISLRTIVDSEQLPEPERSQIASLLDRVLSSPNQASPPRAGANGRAGADLFQYDLLIDRDGHRQEIRAHDGDLSPELETLVRLLTARARGSVRTRRG